MPRNSLSWTCGLILAAVFVGLDVGAPQAAAASPGNRVVTLVTGDRVVLRPDGSTHVHPGDGRAAIAFQVTRVDGRVHVVPSDAVALLQAGRLDERLFDVTRLVEYGYDSRESTPVIVVDAAMSSGGNQGASARATGSTAAFVGRELKAVNGVALDAGADGSFWRELTAPSRAAAAAAAAPEDDQSKVWLDRRLKLNLEQSVPQIGGDVANALGFDGAGVVVAVVDTGIDDTHPDLVDQVLAHEDFTDSTENGDVVGHGTHVASTIAGTGEASDGRYRGVAPGARLLDAKVCVQLGCSESAILAGMQWAVDQGAKLVNMSLGADDSPELDLLEQAVNKLSADYGALFIVSAGNGGGFSAGVASPSSADAALSVGAVDKQDVLAPFSQSGPRVGDGALKPDLVAPGVDITAARSTLSPQTGESPGLYLTASGTSMSAPHVTGSAALVSQRHPDWTGAQIKAVLMNSSRILEQLTPLSQGAGEVSAASAVQLQLLAEPSSLSFGRQAWPHDDDERTDKTVTFRNETDAEVTLDLSLRLSPQSDGELVAGNVFSLSADKLTVAAHDTSSVIITADTRHGADGMITGQLVASSDDDSLHVPFAIEREVESYELKLVHLDHDGQPTSSPRTLVVGDNLTGFPPSVSIAEDGTASIRLPKGDYAVSSGLFGALGEFDMLMHPRLHLTCDRSLVVDAQLTRPIEVEAPLQPAAVLETTLTFQVPMFANTIISDGVVRSANLGDSKPLDGVSSAVSRKWLEDLEAPVPTYQINGAWLIEGEIITGLSKKTQLRQFAKVLTRFARQSSSTETLFGAIGMLPGANSGATGLFPVAVPQERDIYYASEAGQRWSLTLAETGPQTFDTYDDEQLFVAGECSESQWNQAVFGPTTRTIFGPATLTREADTLNLTPTIISDSEQHAGWLDFASASTRLYSDGALVEETQGIGGFYEVPQASARYRAEFSAERTSDAELSTRVELAWEFTSATAAEPIVLPLTLIHPKPPLSQLSSAPHGQPFCFPIELEAQAGAEGTTPAELTVDVSYDDGASWQAAHVSGGAASWTAELKHPQQSGFVSLRAAATDEAGNRVEESIIHAYRLE